MGISFRRWENGNLLGFTRLLPDFRETFNAPYYVVHRADLHAALVRRSSDLGVTLKLGQRVVDYDVNEPSIRLESGGIVTADLVVAADGEEL